MSGNRLWMLALFCTLSCSSAFASETWRTFTRPESIAGVAVQGHYLWCATSGGVVRWNTLDSTYTVFTTADGLPENRISSVAAGPDGKVWCGTWGGGVCCFDGREWITHSRSDGIPFGPIWALAVGPDGSVWVSSAVNNMDGYAGGIYRFDGKSWSACPPVAGMNVHPVTSIAVGPDNTVWCLTGIGISRYDGTHWTDYTAADGIRGFVYTLAIGPDGNPWYGGSGGIGRFRNGEWEFRSGPEMGEVYAFIVEPDSTVWCGTYNGGIVRIEGETVTRYTTADGLPDNIVLSMTLGPDGDVWCGTDKGPACLDGERWKPYRTAPGLADNLVWSLALGKDGSIWCGGRYGISRFDGRNWRTYTSDDGIFRGTVGDIAVDEKGDVWCGVENQGISRFNGYQWTNYPIGNDQQHYFRCLTAVPDGSIWCGTSNGLFRFDGKDWVEYTTADGLAGNNIIAVLIAPDGSIWAAQYTYSSEKGSGVSRFDGKSWKTFTTADGLADFEIRDLAVGPDGSIWCAYRGENAISRYDGSKWTTYSPEDNLLYGADVRSITVADDGTVWCGSYMRGAVRFDGKSWRVFTMRDGLASNEVGIIRTGKNGWVLFGTSNGLSIYEPSTGPDGIGESPHPISMEIRNHPNPFNPSTTVSFSLENAERAELAIYSVTGQKVRTLVTGFLPAGKHSIRWDGRDERGTPVSAGVYVSRLESGHTVRSGKMLLMK